MRKDSSILLLKQLKEKTRTLAKQKGIKIIRGRRQISVTTPEGKKLYFHDWHSTHRFVEKYGEGCN